MAKQLPVLIVDDEPDICDLLAMTLSRMGIESVTAHTVAKASEALDAQPLSLCLTDMRLPDGDGLSLVELIQQQHPSLPVAMITAHGNMDTAIAALKAGAFDFLSKPVDLEQLRQLVLSALKSTTGLDTGAPATELDQQLVGNSLAVADLKQMILKVSRNQAPVFIAGESGTGKEVVARLIHHYSGRSNGPFVAVNCGAIPGELMESEFFGHVKGSFTGANEDKSGLFQAANGGTLLLDEVADLPLAMQVKLLRAIQEKAVRPVGANSEQKIDVRILSATHRNLAELVNRDAFRSDLFYRINVIEMNIPSLRHRIEDIPLLAEHILEKIIRQSDDSGVVTLDEVAITALKAHDYPGNVRELENMLERAVALHEGNSISVADLRIMPSRENATPVDQEVSLENPTAMAIPGAQAAPGQKRGPQPLDSYLQELEKREILAAIEAARWNKTEAAKQLGISFRSLRYRLKKFGLDE